MPAAFFAYGAKSEWPFLTEPIWDVYRHRLAFWNSCSMVATLVRERRQDPVDRDVGLSDKWPCLYICPKDQRVPARSLPDDNRVLSMSISPRCRDEQVISSKQCVFNRMGAISQPRLNFV